jgi:hypothetical protein
LIFPPLTSNANESNNFNIGLSGVVSASSKESLNSCKVPGITFWIYFLIGFPSSSVSVFSAWVPTNSYSAPGSMLVISVNILAISTGRLLLHKLNCPSSIWGIIRFNPFNALFNFSFVTGFKYPDSFIELTKS